MTVDADAIHRQNGLELSVWVRKAGALLWGGLASCGRLSIGQLPSLRREAAVTNRRAGCRPKKPRIVLTDPNQVKVESK